VRIVVDLLKCESNGMCVSAAPGLFDLNDDDELVVLNESPPESDRSAAEAAVRMCPKQALSLYEELPEG
jgi:ferredoxin